MAKIYNRSATTDQILILGIRQAVVQPFYAPGWTDLRFGGFFSIVQPPSAGNPTTDPNDDISTGLGPETVLPGANKANFYWIGVGTPSLQQFIGFNNLGQTGFGGNSLLIASDLALGTTGHYWRPSNSINADASFSFFDVATAPIANITAPGVNPHFYQNVDPGNPAPANYYCGMLAFRLTRPASNSKTITAYVPNPAAHSADMLWTNAPTAATLLAQLQSFPGTMRQSGPVAISVVPTAIYLSWPFRMSRLRCSAYGIFQAA